MLKKVDFFIYPFFYLEPEVLEKIPQWEAHIERIARDKSKGLVIIRHRNWTEFPTSPQGRDTETANRVRAEAQKLYDFAEARIPSNRLLILDEPNYRYDLQKWTSSVNFPKVLTGKLFGLHLGACVEKLLQNLRQNSRDGQIQE